MTRLRSNTISGLPGTSNYQGSIYASGAGAYLLTKTTAPGTDDFTIEFWINSNDASSGSQEGVFGINAQAGGFQGGTGNQIRLSQGRYGGGGTNGGLEVDINGTSVGTGNGNDIIQEGTWHHVAVTRASGTVKIWVDGVEKASGSAAGNVTGTTFVTGYYDTNYTFQGYMSNFRYRKGTAHYTTTFTPPTAVLERTSDTELIFAQSANNAGDGYSSAIHGGTTDIMQVKGNVTANTQAPTLTTSSSVGVVFDGDITFDSPNYMTLPKGTTTQSNRGRAVFAGGYSGGPSPAGAATATMTYAQIQSMGTSIDFGDLTVARWIPSSGASSTRGTFNGGATPTRNNTIDYVTIATTSNATNFGDLTTLRTYHAGFSNSTRAISGGGNDGSSNINTIDYITIASVGNATDFGDMLEAKSEIVGDCSPTRGLFMGGTVPSKTSTVDYITIATTGNEQAFGDLSTGTSSGAALSSNTRAIYAGGNRTPSDYINIIGYFTITTLGNETDFGDLITSRASVYAGTSNNIRGVIVAGFTPSPTFNLNSIEHITIATTGNANDFGDITASTRGVTATSDSHGGIS